MDDKNKINQRENNKRNFKRENDRANSTYQRLIKELEKENGIIKMQFDQVRIITISLKFAILALLSF
jgi:hypothetical protein